MVREGVQRITLDVLIHDEALALLARLVGPQRVNGEPDATAAPVRTCAHLPLALRIATPALVDHSPRTIADYRELSLNPWTGSAWVPGQV